jgi:hypothetical protein
MLAAVFCTVETCFSAVTITSETEVADVVESACAAKAKDKDITELLKQAIEAILERCVIINPRKISQD